MKGLIDCPKQDFCRYLSDFVIQALLTLPQNLWSSRQYHRDISIFQFLFLNYLDFSQ